MAMGLFQSIDWLTKKVKGLCCSIDKIKESGAGSYKVYSALLFQEGTSNSTFIGPGDTAVKGRTYDISGPGTGVWDFSNIGGPKSPDNYSFVATANEIPNDYGPCTLYYDTGAPVVNVLADAITGLKFTYYYLNNGLYKINITSITSPLPDLNKLFILIGNSTTSSSDPQSITYFPASGNEIIISTYNGSGSQVDDILRYTSLEIRLYE